MGDSEALTKALEMLAELIAAKSDGATHSGSIIPQTEVVQKLELMPNDIKLEGVTNYLSWSRRALLILKTKSLERYVLGEEEEPADKASAEWRKWSVINSLIVAWMLNSLIPTISASVEALGSATEIWNTLSNLYSGKGNIMLSAQIEDKVHDLQQGDKTVMEYVTDLQHLWGDLDHLDPLELSHSECVTAGKSWIERRRVMKFLKGLNKGFEGRRANLLHQDKSPTLEEAIAAMTREEVRLKLTNDSESVPHAAFFTKQRSETRDCFNCGQNGHLQHDCTAPMMRGRGRGHGRGYGRRYGRGTHRTARGGHQNSGAPRANIATSEEIGPSTSQGESKEVEQQNEAFGSFAHYVYTEEGKIYRASIGTHKSDPDWVLDSGASKHVAGNINEFDFYSQYPATHKGTVQTADGTSQSIKGVGSVQCTPVIKLTSVLHVPAFPINLVSLGALIDQLDCKVTLDKKMCLIQESQRGRKIGTGTRRRGLWYMDRGEPEQKGSPVLAAFT